MTLPALKRVLFTVGCVLLGSGTPYAEEALAGGHILDSLLPTAVHAPHRGGLVGEARHGYVRQIETPLPSRFNPADRVESYFQARDILADPEQEALRPAALSRVFVINWDRPSYEEVAEPHLRWLLDVVSVGKPSVEGTKYSDGTITDAYTHLRYYFPYMDCNSHADWWLRSDPTPESCGRGFPYSHYNDFGRSPRMQAVHRLAQEFELVDWLQARWAVNPLEVNWIWALHHADHPYWEENRRIVRHAWKRWQAGDGIEWLEVVMRRIHPDDPLADEVRADAKEILDSVTATDDTPGLRAALGALREHSVRLLVAKPDTPERDARIHALLRNSPSSHSVMHWYTYQGKWETARRFLPKSGEPRWQALLATDFATFENTMRDMPDPDAGLLTLLPAEKLFEMAKSHPRLRTQLLRTAVTRAFLLGDDEALARYAARLGRETGDIALLNAQETDTVFDYILRSPRMRPVLVGRHRMGIGTRHDIDPAVIDGHNPNDNNWWCAFDREKTLRALGRDHRIEPAGWSSSWFLSARILRRSHFFGPRNTHPLLTPQRKRSYLPWDHSLEGPEFDRYFEAQAAQFRRHPAFAMMDKGELDALEKIPSGPRYLTERVIEEERGNRFKFWRSTEAREKSAERLHLAVRTTRYGCRRDGPHGTYSREAWRILHRDYGDSVWARATPYWFDKL